MTKEFSSIMELKAIREQKSRLSEREQALSSPVLCDTSLILFAPSVLAGGRLPNGIRAEIAGVFPDVSPCVISNNIADVSFIYQQYKDFRQDIEYLYNQIIERLKNKGLIK